MLEKNYITKKYTKMHQESKGTPQLPHYALEHIISEVKDKYSITTGIHCKTIIRRYQR